MSVEVMTWVFRHSQSKGSARLVLLALADEASSTGEISAYKRSQTWIASKANLSRRGVQLAIADLVETGELAVTKPGDGRVSADYQIMFEGRTPFAPGAHAVPARGEQGAPPSSRSLPVEPVTPSSRGDETDEIFERFWTKYPRRQGTSKKAAKSAFKSAVKRGHLEQVRSGFSRDLITWAKEHRAAEHIPHAATWLNQERYMPETDTPVTAATASSGGEQDLDAETGVFYPDGTPWPKWTKGFRGSDEVPSWKDRRGNIVYEDPTR